ncbi:hypothetical protein GA0074695_2906 [Micromonospora viridifaciens]|uniref:Uncharacterized protein n=1 Tax=Micromonospora viridifaciens TaxID=1881 RepID=A0A1C4X0P1_MICVI|nr:hypothetical protein [Micromonospora viridifaciens]SCF02009.1 hypothetical protein GA0074695_2906 [Micromonospora viridifaciens]
MAERSTAHSGDRAARHHDDAASGSGSRISRQSRLAADDSDWHYEWQGAAAPQWREDLSESYQPENAHPEYEGRHGRHRRQQHEDQYEQYDGAYRQHRHAYRPSDPLAYPEPEYDEPDRAYWQERRDQDLYRPIEASSVHEDAYGAQSERYALPAAGDADEEYYPHDVSAGRNEYRHEESGPQAPEAEEYRRPRGKHSHARVAVRPRPASRRRRWLIPAGGLALGALFCTLAFMWESGQPPEGGLPVSAATTPPGPSEEPIAFPEVPATASSSAAPPSSSAMPSATPSPTHSVTPSATPRVTSSATPSATPSVTPTQTQSSSPVLLGPSSSRGVTNMVQQYCDRYTGGSADPRNDGRWQCTKLFSASIVDIDVACRDRYDSGAYARTSNPGDPYAWRCYQ